ncbi:MAG: response regulator transcription factor [Actinomycetota bacterium]
MSSGRVLIVEDEEAIADLVKRTLGDAGIESDIATTGTEGLWMVREGAYGAVCLDILLPEMNGYNVCRTLRNEGNDVPILMLTAKTGEFDEADGLDLGADDYLRKPFAPAVLTARVRALLRRGGGRAPVERLTVGAVAFDPRSRRCEVDGVEVPLTAKEGLLLETLLRSGPEPLARPALIDRVWGFDFDGHPNVVDVYIGYLRRKIGAERIETVRGVGFRVRD